MPKHVLLHIRCHGNLLHGKTLLTDTASVGNTTTIFMSSEMGKISDDWWTQHIAHLIFTIFASNLRNPRGVVAIDEIVKDIGKDYIKECNLFLERLYILHKQRKGGKEGLVGDVHDWIDSIRGESDTLKQETFLQWIVNEWNEVTSAVCGGDTSQLRNVCRISKVALRPPGSHPSYLRLHILHPLSLSVKRNGATHDVLLTFQASNRNEFNTVRYVDDMGVNREWNVVTESDTNRIPPWYFKKHNNREDAATMSRISLSQLLQAFRDAYAMGDPMEIYLILESCLAPPILETRITTLTRQ